MEKINRQRRSGSAWREIVERQGHSGLTVPEFCEREGIKAGSLYGWRSRLREGSQRPPVSLAVPKKPKMSAAPAPGFIDLGSLGTSGSRFEVRLELGGVPRAGMRSTGWHAVCVRQPARHANARFVFRPLRILYLGEASRGGKVYRGLVSGAHPRDGLDDIKAPVGRDRAGEVAQAVSTGAEQKRRYQHGAFAIMLGCRTPSQNRCRMRLR
jgi:hypothetical protein